VSETPSEPVARDDQTERSGSEHEQPVPAFPFQLVDAYLRACQVQRRDALADDPELPTFVTHLETRGREDPPGLDADLTVTVTLRFRPEASCVITATITGVFVKTGELRDVDEQRFRGADCAVLLWPYARAHVGELARMTGLQLPPLPTIDVRETLRGAEAPSAQLDDAG
jgi:preprotein translocase subunit SecB